MKKIDIGFDTLLKSNYELYSIQLFELRDLSKSWYDGVDLKSFDNRTGITCNYFFAYREDSKYYLMDGFNRLFTDYGKMEVDCTVYLKVLVDKLEDNQLMYIMFTLNMWKLTEESGTGSFRVTEFFDRGFRLFLHSKFNIDFYNWKDDWQNRTRYQKDIDILDYYFRNEREFADYFKHNLDNVAILFYQKNIVNDIKEIVECNNYLKPPFNNYDIFLNGFILFLSWRRCSGDNNEYKFQTYLDKLYEDKKFFKKLPTMCGNDSTRKNIYTFYRNLYKLEK